MKPVDFKPLTEKYCVLCQRASDFDKEHSNLCAHTRWLEARLRLLEQESETEREAKLTAMEME